MSNTHNWIGALQQCDEEKLLGHLGVVLYEYLGEEYPEVLGSILGALKGIVNVIGMTKMTPPIKDLLPRLTPILKNRHEKVQENCIVSPCALRIEEDNLVHFSLLALLPCKIILEYFSTVRSQYSRVLLRRGAFSARVRF